MALADYSNEEDYWVGSNMDEINPKYLPQQGTPDLTGLMNGGWSQEEALRYWNATQTGDYATMNAMRNDPRFPTSTQQPGGAVSNAFRGLSGLGALGLSQGDTDKLFQTATLTDTDFANQNVDWAVPAALAGMGGYAAGGAAGLWGEGTGLAGTEAAAGSAPLTGTMGGLEGTALPAAGEAAGGWGAVLPQSTGPGVSAAGASNWLAGGTGAGSGAAGSTALGRLLRLGQTGQDALSVGGAVAPGVLGYLGAGKQSDAYRDVANQYLNIGAPYRSSLEASYQPGFDLFAQPGYGESLDRLADISARSYSKFGNPAGSPTSQAGIFRDVLNEGYNPMLTSYRGQLGQFGGLGLNTAGAGSMGGAGVAGGQYDAIGYGLGSLMNPQPKWEDIFKQMGTGQKNNYTTVQR